MQQSIKYACAWGRTRIGGGVHGGKEPEVGLAGHSISGALLHQRDAGPLILKQPSQTLQRLHDKCSSPWESTQSCMSAERVRRYQKLW